METLNYKTVGAQPYLLKDGTEKILQFGEGNFLRAFVQHFVDMANEKTGFDAKTVIVQPIEQGGLQDFFDSQQGLYTLYLRGFENGEAVNSKRVISTVSRYINPYKDYEQLMACAENPELRYVVSNTTEAGIVYDPSCKFDDAPPASFPAKLTAFLHHRWKHFKKDNGLVILSCELIDNNGKELENCVEQYIAQWGLEPEFSAWLKESCLFCSTLVDRIVTGYPRSEADALNKENGYIDNLMDTGEVFGLWVIEGPEWLKEELPFERAGLPVKVVADHSPYKKQKVRILNGAHTSMVPAAYLCGQDIVRDCMYDEDINSFIEKSVWDEIIPVVPLPKAELEAFASSVVERFKNPFIDHSLLAIALNSTSKWKARVLPSLKEFYEINGRPPKRLAFSLAAYIAFYRCHKGSDGKVYGSRDGEEYQLQDDEFVLDFFLENSSLEAEKLVKLTLSNSKMWGEDLTKIQGLEAMVSNGLNDIDKNGMRSAMQSL